MKEKAFLFWENLRSSYWFLPAVIVLVDILLLSVTLHFDAQNFHWPGWLILFFAENAEGASALMSTIIGAVITVMATVFSIMILVLIMAASLFGMRLLKNFMKDAKSQFVLGIFVATFVHCLVTLLNIGSNGGAFVPRMTLSLALVLTFGSIFVLILFIHHIAVRIQTNTVVSDLWKDFSAVVRHLYPKEEDRKTFEDEPSQEEGRQQWERAQEKEPVPVKTPGYGYLEAVEVERLCDLCEEKEMMAEILVRPGDFIHEDETVFHLYSFHGHGEKVCKQVGMTLTVGHYRTVQQDIRYAVEQLVELAERALSPGINEPLVAALCVDYLSLGFARILQRPFPRTFHFDREGYVRVIQKPVTFPELFRLSFFVIAHYGKDGPIANVLKSQTENLARKAKRPEDRQILQQFLSLMEQEENQKAA